MYLKTALALSVAFALSACSSNSSDDASQQATDSVSATALAASNPFAKDSSLQYQAPDFTVIKKEHFKPAFEVGMQEHLAEINAIAEQSDAATFDNTVLAMEKSGKLLGRVSSVFFNLSGSNSDDEIRAIQGEMAPKLSAHNDDIYLNDKLFQRVKSVYEGLGQSDLDSESKRLVEVYYKRFVQAGAKLTAEQKAQIRELNAQEAKLTNEFAQRVLALGGERAVLVDDVAELKGLSDAQIGSLAKRASDAGHDGKYLIPLVNTTRQDIMASIEDRELRQRIWEASAYRGLEGENETASIAAKLAQLRVKKAKLLGFNNWAEYRMNNAMAQKPENVRNMLASMVPAVVKNATKEAEAIKKMMKSEGTEHALQPWDWAYYAEKVRQKEYAIDEAEVKQYFEFNSVLEKGVFFTMNKLYGITFKARPDLPVYHPDVKAYEVFDADGTSIAIFYGDYFARTGKRGGAWMNSFVRQSKFDGTTPVIVNVMNIPKGAEGQPTLVSYDNVTTMFHEMGHALHGMFSDVNYRSLAGTAVSRDYVEFPSTFEEDWAQNPEVLANYAKHYKTGEAIPKALLDKIIKSRSFNQGYDTLEYMAAALVDLEWHSLEDDTLITDVKGFEQKALEKNGVAVPAIPPRYKSTYFSHIFAGGYSASYYAYLWSEILAADAFAYMQTTGGLTRENGDNYRKNILSVGNTRPPMESYKAFRGQEPTTDALLKRRGIN
ncbi:M3 family metallopeptidase [Paraferrimonas haliotis]|uniref:Dipeptidyl carboxypeptidase II n=1 Tax=Paraferrimonas haliotis TaxID=2013866 RepID=A0AA37TLJ2_9GAMM|nr:M3 family metallopeptidase [Paraferrimonas haliotis]GLS83369.1 dipeptidyl carboxypeptidase II [Paraferrimonas haliotis]